MRGDTVLLVVEVAKSSLEFDLGTKAKTCAQFGVRDYWVVDADTLHSRIHRDPDPGGYASVRVCRPDETLVALLVSGLSIRMARLELG